jgi:hypothetical protein
MIVGRNRWTDERSVTIHLLYIKLDCSSTRLDLYLSFELRWKRIADRRYSNWQSLVLVSAALTVQKHSACPWSRIYCGSTTVAVCTDCT